MPAFLIAKHTMVFQVTKALSRSLRYLESQVSRLRKDPYSVCIVAYALTLTGSKKAWRAQKEMEKQVVLKGTEL